MALLFFTFGVFAFLQSEKVRNAMDDFCERMEAG